MSVTANLQPRRASGPHSRLAPALCRLGEALEHAAARRARRRVIAASKRELHALDDRTLRDIGVPRDRIDAVVAGVGPPEDRGR